MILSQGLLISLAFTTVIGILLFFFVRQRTNAVEEKINTLIQFVQTETLKLQQPTVREEMSVYQTPNGNHVQSAGQQDLIDVSDDESESDGDSDSDGSSYISDAESDDEGSVDDLNTTRIVSMNNLEQEHNTNAEDVISLSVIKPVSAPEEESVEETYTKEEIMNSLEEELDTLSLSDLSDGEENTDGETQDTETKNDELTINYKKLLVGELRSIAENKGLTENAKKLKKHELLELLEKDSA
jgi:hypothetical protein